VSRSYSALASGRHQTGSSVIHADARSAFLSILPLNERGKASTNSTLFGFL
jgi:hypothetical protein